MVIPVPQACGYGCGQVEQYKEKGRKEDISGAPLRVK